VTDELNFVLQARREKLEALEAAGIAPYAYGFDRRHSASDAQSLLGAAEEGPTVSLAGRIVAWRSHGKTTFAHLSDSTGRIQLYFKKDQIGEKMYSLLAHFDLGDIIGVHGPLFRTRTGEVTVRVDRVEIRCHSGRKRRSTVRSFVTRDSQIPSSAIGSATRISRYIPRFARCSSRARG